MKKLQRALALLLTLVLLLSALVSCESYRPRKSSKKEASEVFTLGEDTVTFEVLYTFFRNRCEQIDGFAPAYFDGADGEAHFAAVMADAVAEIGEIYAMLALCRKAEIDPEGDMVEDKIKEYLKICVEGGQINEYTLEGAGSYSAFLDTMKKNYSMNDAVVRLMLRSAICEDLLTEHYENTLRYTVDDVREFFESDDCIRIIWGSRGHSVQGFTEVENLDMMKEIRRHFKNDQDRQAVQLSLNQTSDFYMGRNTKDNALYGELVEVAFSLAIGETSEILDLGSEGYFVIKRLPKLSSDLDNRYRELVPVYLTEELYNDVEETAAAALEGIVYTDFYRGLTADDFF